MAVEVEAETIRLNVVTDYYNLQNADQQVLIQQAAVTNALASLRNAHLRDAQAQEQAGIGTRFDTLTAQVQLANSIQNLTTAQANQQAARRQLAQRNIAEQNRRLALSSIGPQVSLAADYGVEDPFATSYTNTSGGFDTYTVGGTVSLLLFDGGAARANAAQQEVNKAISEVGFANIRNQLRFNVEHDCGTRRNYLENLSRLPQIRAVILTRLTALSPD